MIHIAVLLPQYLDMILAETKTVECRLTKQARDPYERIEPGERIYFKLSAGEYAATAIADHVMFESGLTPARVKELKRDYNGLIGGEDAFWNWKRDSNYVTLVWLREVQPIDNGPLIRPLQGVAWLCLDDEPAWRRMAPIEKNGHDELLGEPARRESFFIEITAGNLKNNSLYVTSVLDRFPEWTIGGANKAEAARPITLMLHDGPTVKTDIVGPRKLLRTRVWGSWFRKHRAKPKDRVVFTSMGDGQFFVGLAGNS
jgi:ASC-1-like (ASCH) protein